MGEDKTFCFSEAVHLDSDRCVSVDRCRSPKRQAAVSRVLSRQKGHWEATKAVVRFLLGKEAGYVWAKHSVWGAALETMNRRRQADRVLWKLWKLIKYIWFMTRTCLEIAHVPLPSVNLDSPATTDLAPNPPQEEAVHCTPASFVSYKQRPLAPTCLDRRRR